jgi:hypothetical protein
MVSGPLRGPCAWCSGPIPAEARRDAVTCSQRCRQARHRFVRSAGRAAAASTGRARRLAYADPPYPGLAWYYRGHPDYAGEVDHGELIRRLSTYDGWALSTSAAALPAVLALCPPGVRVAAWHRGERPARSWRPLNAWEPVVYAGARRVDPSTLDGRRVDSLVCGVAPLTTLPGRVIGTKPPAFSRWLFDLLGAQRGDTFHDLYPGSGAVGRAWLAYTGGAGELVDSDASPRAGHDGSALGRSRRRRPGREDQAAGEAEASRAAVRDGSGPRRRPAGRQRGELVEVPLW